MRPVPVGELHRLAAEVVVPDLVREVERELLHLRRIPPRQQVGDDLFLQRVTAQAGAAPADRAGTAFGDGAGARLLARDSDEEGHDVVARRQRAVEVERGDRGCAHRQRGSFRKTGRGRWRTTAIA